MQKKRKQVFSVKFNKRNKKILVKFHVIKC